MFEKITPESVGVSSEKVLDFIKTLDDERFHNHSIIMAKGDKIFAECYYKPFNENFLHRMYSVSKSFVAIAVGMAMTEGILSLDDVIVDYFPEFRNENVDEFHEECTIRDMLSMQSNIADHVIWWGKYKSRVEAYYTKKTNKIPGTLYFYDSVGSFLLGCIIEKLTGKPFLEYLKEKVLLEIGFSKESYTLTEPGGFTVGDSGVMCTARDLLIFARFIMKKGEWNGKQYVDRTFMEEAIRIQTTNDLAGMAKYYGNQGYGYLIWKTHPDGFSLVGMGDQLAICDMKNDVCFVITSDNQTDKSARRVLFHEYYKHFLPTVQSAPLPENPQAVKKLEDYTASAVLICQCGEKTSPVADKVNGVKYVTKENPLNITYFKLDLDKNVLEFEKDGKELKLEFSVGENKITKFSLGDRAAAHKMGFREEGRYNCATSAAWVEDKQLTIMCQVVDTYFGGLYISISFKDERASFVMHSSGQYVFDNADGYAIGKKEMF